MTCVALAGVEAWATHLVGGDFSYVHVGGDDYEITLTIYRDCSPANTNGTGFDDQVAIGMWRRHHHLAGPVQRVVGAG